MMRPWTVFADQLPKAPGGELRDRPASDEQRHHERARAAQQDGLQPGVRTYRVWASRKDRHGPGGSPWAEPQTFCHIRRCASNPSDACRRVFVPWAAARTPAHAQAPRAGIGPWWTAMAHSSDRTRPVWTSGNGPPRALRRRRAASMLAVRAPQLCGRVAGKSGPYRVSPEGIAAPTPEAESDWTRPPPRAAFPGSPCAQPASTPLAAGTIRAEHPR